MFATVILIMGGVVAIDLDLGWFLALDLVPWPVVSVLCVFGVFR